MRAAYVLVIDLVMVVLFAGIGRRSHEHGLSVLGVLQTAAPFLAALLVGWAFAYLISGVRSHQPRGGHAFRPARLFPNGALIWVITVGVGMTARALLTTRTVDVQFVLIGGFFLGVFLLGWRAVARVIERRRTAVDVTV